MDLKILEQLPNNRSQDEDDLAGNSLVSKEATWDAEITTTRAETLACRAQTEPRAINVLDISRLLVQEGSRCGRFRVLCSSRPPHLALAAAASFLAFSCLAASAFSLAAFAAAALSSSFVGLGFGGSITGGACKSIAPNSPSSAVL
jgi:hypothetical protein